MLSAVVVTQNEEKNIRRCLESLRFTDEIVVVDALSEDATVDIATSFNARVVSNKWPGYAAQKQMAIDLAAGEWILLVDADEEVPPELAREVRETILAAPEANGFRVRRRNQFLGDWVRHGPWAEDFQTRLFKKMCGRIARRPVHEGVQVEGSVGTLKSPLNHFTHQTLSDSLRRMNVYTSLEARERLRRRKIRLADAVFPPAAVFLRYYLAKGCWRDGVRGLLLSATTAMYKSVLYVKIWFLQRDHDAQLSR